MSLSRLLKPAPLESVCREHQTGLFRRALQGLDVVAGARLGAQALGELEELVQKGRGAVVTLVSQMSSSPRRVPGYDASLSWQGSEHPRLTVTHLRLTLWRSSIHVWPDTSVARSNKGRRARLFVAASYGRLLLAIGQTRRKSETNLGSACGASLDPVRSTSALDPSEATTEIGAHFLHVHDRNPTTIADDGM